MKKLAYLLFLCCFVSMGLNAGAQTKKGAVAYGKKFVAKEVMTPEALVKTMNGKKEMPGVVVAGEIAQVCQAEGCWLKLVNKDGAPIMVKFKDHAFLIPKDLAGRKVTINGTAISETVSVEEQKHLAKDAGKSEADIKTITQPKTELRIEATGLVIGA